MAHLLLVDDDLTLCELLQEYLQGEGFEVTVRHDGETALATVNEMISDPDIQLDAILLDVMLPIHHGFELLDLIRKEHSNIPILMLTAKGGTQDRIYGLELGADDYLPKPCNPRELVARLKAILRRTHQSTAQVIQQDVLKVDNLELRFATHTVTLDDQSLVLTGAEFTVLSLLMLQAGQVISKEYLTEKALNRKLTPYDRSIDVHVSNIRKKLNTAGANRDMIINIRGAGYMLTLEPPH